MSASLRISETLALPIDAATGATAILGLRGSGKTFGTAVLAEELHGAGVPVCVIDPVGVWWGLRSDALGTGPGLPFILFGGDRADVPLEETSGELIADVVIENELSAVLDLSHLRKGARRRFMTDFAEQLFNRSRSSMHLVVDEAPMFAPQRADKGAERLLGAMEDIVLRGRARGIGISLIAQRAQTLHKSLLSQCEILIALRQSHPRDIDAIEEWVEVHSVEDDSARVVGALPSLATGEGFVWSPSLGILERVRIRPRRTFDSSATPKPGERRTEPKARAEVDLDALRVRIGSTVERAKADDPKALRARIAELEALLAAQPSAEPERVEVPVVHVEAIAAFGRASAALARVGEELAEAARLVAEGTALAAGAISEDTPIARVPAKAFAETRVEAEPRMVAPPPANGAATALRKGARSMLAALASMHPRALTRAQIATLAGLSPQSGTFSTYLGDLRTAGFIEAVGATEIAITAAGRKAAGPVAKPTSTAQLHALWAQKFRAGGRRMLAELVRCYPKGVTRDELARRVEISAESGTFSTYIGELVNNGLVEKRGRELFASSSLFLGGTR